MIESKTVETLKEFLAENEEAITKNGKVINWNEVNRIEVEFSSTPE